MLACCPISHTHILVTKLQAEQPVHAACPPHVIVNIIFIQSNLAPNILNQARLLENGSVKNAPLPCFKMIFLI